MAGENPIMASTEDWDAAEQAAIAALPDLNLNTPENLRATKDKFSAWRQQNQHTREQVKSLTELFLDKKKLANAVGNNVVGVGNTAAQSHIQSQQKAQDGATALTQLAKATDIETTAITNKFYAGWVGPITMIGKILNACGMSNWGNKCIAFAQDLAPQKIETQSAEAAMAARQGAVRIDASAPAATALSVLNAAMLTTDPDNIGMGAAGGAKVQQQIAAVTAANANATPAPVATSAATPTAASTTVSTANIAALTNEILAFDKSKKGGMTEKQASAQAGKILAIDNDKAGDHNGKLNTPAEADGYKKSTAYIGLPSGEKKIMDMFIDESLKQKVSAAPSVAAPAPVVS